MRNVARLFGNGSDTSLLIPAHERIVDRLYLVAFATLLILMIIAYACLCGFLLWVFFV